jgi:hypothetical protein
MKKYLVKHRQSGVTREMTEASYKLAGEKRGWEIVSEVKAPSGDETVVQKEMRRLREEQAKISSESKDQVSQEYENISEDVKEPKKRGPKKKTNEA